MREAVLQLAVMHPQKEALELFAREIAPAGTSWSPGTTGAGGRPSPSPAIRQFAFLVDKARLAPQVRMGDAGAARWRCPPARPPVPRAACRAARARAARRRDRATWSKCR